MGETWRGIYPITALVRDALRKKAGSEASGGLSAAEETLLTVCEFWFAVNTGALTDQLEVDAIAQLLRAQGAFARVGAVRIASTLRAAIARLARARAPASAHKVAEEIAEALAQTEDPVDQLIARFAIDEMNMTLPARQPDRRGL